jgi:hypothetical protein
MKITSNYKINLKEIDDKHNSILDFNRKVNKLIAVEVDKRMKESKVDDIIIENIRLKKEIKRLKNSLYRIPIELII